jgi:hypothetical protein
MDDPAAVTERVIDRFGGIRPMAAKLDTPVTTVQGWKKRGIIPQSRHADILAAAAREGIAVDAAELAQTDPGGPTRPEPRPTEAAPDTPAPTPLPAPPARPRRSLAGVAALAVSFTALLAVAAGGAAAWKFYLQPLDARVAALESRAGMSATDDAHARDDLAQRVAKLEAEAARAPAAPAGGGQPTGDADARIAALEQQLNALKASAGNTEQIAKRLSELQLAAGGREVLTQSIQDIQSSTAATQGEVDRLRTQLAAVSPRLDKVEASMADRRQQALRAEALVLAVGQLRRALEDSKPFAKELAAVKGLTSGDSDMSGLIDQLQPFADEGVRTQEDLEKDLARLAPEMVRSAIVGDGQSWWRQALYHIESVISIRRIGAAVPGDDVDAVVARAQGKLDENDLKGAVAALQGLAGLPAEVAATWIRDANNRVTVDNAEAEMSRLAVERISGGSQPPAANPGGQ